MSEAEVTTQPAAEDIVAQELVQAPAGDAPAAEAPAVEAPAAAADAPAVEAAPVPDGTSLIKTTAQIDYKDRKKNNKFDPSVREVTDDPEAIRKQVEFYFGDWNFPQDKFMWESCGGSENKPIAIEKIHSFKRMRTFQPYSAVVAALRDSKILEVSGEEGSEVVKRKTPYKPMAEGKVKVEAATVYVKGFGDENPDTQFDLESFFAQFGEVKGLKLRRTVENLFKGSVFVTFADEETARKFIATDPKPTWKGHELKIMTKKEYCDEKSELIRQGKIEPSSGQARKFYEGRDFSGKNKGRGRDQDDWKKRREQDQKNGFRGGRDKRGGRGGRGGRGRGRGGRDTDRGRRDETNGNKDKTYENGVPAIQSTAEADKKESNGKRAREEDSAAGEPAAKKIDNKKEVTAETTAEA